MAEDRTNGWVCVGMSLLAGLSTTLGSGVVFLLPGQTVTASQMAFVLALAGGVMLSVTVLEFWLPMLSGGKPAVPVLFSSALGAGAFWLLARLVPEPKVVEGQEGHGHHAVPTDAELACKPSGTTYGNADEDDPPPAPVRDGQGSEEQRRWRLAMVLMLSLTAHNFPEGFAVAISALQSNRLGLVVMLAIAMHNIPEGIAIAVPVLAATGSQRKALWLSFLSGMAEPLGAVVALLAVNFLGGGGLSDATMENLLCAVGGVMCAVAVQELIPEAFRQGRPLQASLGLFAGFLLMWATIQLGA